MLLFFKKRSKNKASLDSEVADGSAASSSGYESCTSDEVEVQDLEALSSIEAGDDLEASANTTDADAETDDDANASIVNASQDNSSEDSQIFIEEIEALLEEPSSFFDTESEAKAGTNTSSSSSVNYLANKREVKLSNIDVRSSCGFDFSGVVEGHLTRAENERTGSRHVVYASGENFSKIQNDLQSLQPLFQTLSSSAGRALYGIEFPDCADMLSLLRPFGGKKGGRSHGMQGVVTLTVREQDDAGCNLKYPVMMKAACATRRVVGDKDCNSDVVRAQMDSLVLDIAYLPNGRADIGRLVRWEGRKGYLCEFRWSGAEQKYVPMKVNIASTPGNWKPVS